MAQSISNRQVISSRPSISTRPSIPRREDVDAYVQKTLAPTLLNFPELVHWFPCDAGAGTYGLADSIGGVEFASDTYTVGGLNGVNPSYANETLGHNLALNTGSWNLTSTNETLIFIAGYFKDEFTLGIGRSSAFADGEILFNNTGSLATLSTGLGPTTAFVPVANDLNPNILSVIGVKYKLGETMTGFYTDSNGGYKETGTVSLSAIAADPNYGDFASMGSTGNIKSLSAIGAFVFANGVPANLGNAVMDLRDDLEQDIKGLPSQWSNPVTFVPSLLTNIVSWYRSDDITTSGSDVIAWPDKVASNDLTSSTNKPQLVSSALDGTDAISFTVAIGGYMNNASGPSIDGTTHVFIVARRTALTANATYYDADSPKNASTVHFGTGDVFVAYSGANHTNAKTVAQDEWHILGIYWDGNNTKSTINNADEHVADSGVAPTGTGFTLGSKGGNRSNNGDFDIVEMVVCSAEVTGSELTNLFAYFNARYPSL